MTLYAEAEQKLQRVIEPKNDLNTLWQLEALRPINKLAGNLALDVVFARLQEWNSLRSSVKRSPVTLQRRRDHGD